MTTTTLDVTTFANLAKRATMLEESGAEFQQLGKLTGAAVAYGARLNLPDCYGDKSTMRFNVHGANTAKALGVTGATVSRWLSAAEKYGMDAPKLETVWERLLAGTKPETALRDVLEAHTARELEAKRAKDREREAARLEATLEAAQEDAQILAETGSMEAVREAREARAALAKLEALEARYAKREEQLVKLIASMVEEFPGKVPAIRAACDRSIPEYVATVSA